MHVVEESGVWWFRRPDGERFFSVGVNCVDPGAERTRYRANNPEYAAFRYYASKAAWAKETLARLQQWNINTLGGWCDTAALAAAPTPNLPYTVVLHLGSSFQAPWCDLFSPKLAAELMALTRKLVAPHRNQPHLLGYFTDNELGWWSDTLFVFFLHQPRHNATRQRLLALLWERYHGSFAALQRDFITGKARSFASIDSNPSVPLTLRPEGQGKATVDAFVYMLARRYYQLVHAAIRRDDPRHLILGDRYAQFCPLPVAQAARGYVDVISTNYGADFSDGRLAGYYLEMLHRASGRPVLVSEFYFAANENRSGNKNSSGGFPVVATQAERAVSTRRNLEELARLPYVVGAHWFQFYDEPAHGRPDGENYNMGLVDTANRPYDELTAVFQETPVALLHAEARQTPPHTERVPNQASLPVAELMATPTRDGLTLTFYNQRYDDPALYPRRTIPATARERVTITGLQGANTTLPILLAQDKRIQRSQHGLRQTFRLHLPRHALGSPPLRVTLTQPGSAPLQLWELPAVPERDSRRKHNGFLLCDGDRVAFYGDSITEQGHYIAALETFVRTRFPARRVAFFNRGWAGDTSWGGAGGAPEERVRRDIAPLQPTMVTVLLGMNDGGYVPFDPKIYAIFGEWYEKLYRSLHAAAPSARMTLVTSTPYDDFTQRTTEFTGYNTTLQRFSEVVRGIAQREGWPLVDGNTPLVRVIQEAYAHDPQRARELIPDSIHPSPAGHLVLAHALLRGWGAPATVTTVALDLAQRQVIAAEGTQVFGITDRAWYQHDRALPFPLAHTDPLVALALRTCPFVEQLNQQRLTVVGLPPGRYRLSIDQSELGVFSAEALRTGINLAVLETPMLQRARRVAAQVTERQHIAFLRWREFEVQQPLSPGTRSAIRGLTAREAELEHELRLLVQPPVSHYRLVPTQ